MKIITNANQLKIIKSVSTPTISKTLDDQTNDGHLFIKQTKTISIPLIHNKNNYVPLIPINHTSITLINIKNNYKHHLYTLKTHL